MNSEIIIKAKIWEKDDFSLIDFSDKEFKTKKMKINSSGVLYRNQKAISFSQGENHPQSPNDLLRIHKNIQIGKYVVNCGNYSKDLNKLIEEKAAFLVYRGFYINNSNNKDVCQYHRLFQGDIFKIGRIYFKVLDIHLKESFELKSNNIDNSMNRTIIKNSSFNSTINGQQIIRGSLSPSFRRNNMNKLFNNNNNVLNFKKSNFSKKESYDSFIHKKDTILPKINYTNELMPIIKDSQNIININNKNNDKNKKSKKYILKKKNNLIHNKAICRICYRDDSDEKDPLISPCICKGSMKYIHYKCLKNWLNSKIENEILKNPYDKDKNIITYNIKDISCELCKEKLPDFIKYNNKYYNITFYKPNFEEFIVLESVGIYNKEKIKYIHIISFDNKNTIFIGRTKECELSLNDLAVSRYHCFIRKIDGELFLEDNLSKYGTLVLIQNNNMIINDLVPLKLQINQIFIKLKIKLPVNFKCCGYSMYQNTSESRKYDYQIQNRKCFDVLSYFIIKEDDSNSYDDNDNDNEIENNESINSNNISKLILDNDDNNDIIYKDNEIKNKINKIILKEKESNNTKFDINSFFYNSSMRFKKIIIKKDLNNKYELPELGKINIDIFKDSTSLNINKSSQLFYHQHKKKQINLIKLNNNNSNIDKTKI